jgi:hypothetical protein
MMPTLKQGALHDATLFVLFRHAVRSGIPDVVPKAADNASTFCK